jgi:hypothetical protein
VWDGGRRGRETHHSLSAAPAAVSTAVAAAAAGAAGACVATGAVAAAQGVAGCGGSSVRRCMRGVEGPPSDSATRSVVDMAMGSSASARAASATDGAAGAAAAVRLTLASQRSALLPPAGVGMLLATGAGMLLAAGAGMLLAAGVAMLADGGADRLTFASQRSALLLAAGAGMLLAAGVEMLVAGGAAWAGSVARSAGGSAGVAGFVGPAVAWIAAALFVALVRSSLFTSGGALRLTSFGLIAAPGDKIDFVLACLLASLEGEATAELTGFVSFVFPALLSIALASLPRSEPSPALISLLVEASLFLFLSMSHLLHFPDLVTGAHRRSSSVGADSDGVT